MTKETTGGFQVWILVDQSSRELTFESVAEYLRDKDGTETQIVTITEVIGSMARGAIAGGAERLLRGLRVAVQGRSDEDLVGAIRRDRPDLLVVTDARYVRALGLLDSLTGTPTLQVGVFPDYNWSPEWAKSSLHGFVVGHQTFKDGLVAAGYPEDRILVAGPAIQSRFAGELESAAARESFGFGDDEKIVLVRANGFDAGTADKLMFQSKLADANARFIFHHDGDQAMASTLRKAANQYGLRALMFGQVNDLERYMAASDLVIAAPTDAYVAELVALDRPLLFVGPEGAHAGQVDFLTGVGAAAHAPDLLRVGTEIDRCLKDEWLEAARTAAGELSEKSGSRDVADALAVALEKRDAWLVEPKPEPTDDMPGEDDEDVPSNSAFEAIGQEESAAETGETDDDVRPSGSISYAGISKAEAKEQLASLILMERDIERRLEELEKQQERWRNRLELAREWNEDDLATEAEEILRGYMAEAEEVGGELQDVRKQKGKLKTAARGGKVGPEPAGASKLSQMEGRFRKMEVDNDLKALKDRIRRELGE